MYTPYFQYSTGWEGEKLVVPNSPYTKAADYKTFVLTDADGNFGIFKPDGTLVTGALSQGDKFFFAVKRDGVVEKSSVFTYTTTGTSPISVRKTVGGVGVSQVTTVTIVCGGTSNCSDPNSCCTSPLKDYIIGVQDPQTSDRMQRESWEYYMQGKNGKTIVDVLNKLKDKVNDDTSTMNMVRGRKVTMSAITTTAGATASDPTTYSFTLTGVDFKPFQLLISGFYSMTNVTTTAAVEPAGLLKNMAQLEFEGLVRKGWETKYIDAPFISSEWGQPSLFSASNNSLSFTQYMIGEVRHEDSNIAGVERHYRRQYIDVAVPKGSALETKMNLVFTV